MRGPVRRLGDWIDERTGHRALVRRLLDEPIPGGARWAYVFGSVLVGLFAVQAVTGVLLMTAYSPSAQTAWASVYYIQHRLSLGWLIRGLHHYGAHAMIVVLVLHLVQVTTFGAHRAPREINYWLGLCLLGVVFGFGLTGYLLPWDQKGYWATRVATNIASTVPIVGAGLQRLLVGGTEYGHLTLTRFYALHVAVLPGTFVLLVLAHVTLFRRHHVTPPARADLGRVGFFYPDQALRDTAAVAAVLGACLALAFARRGASLDAPADPTSDYPARPEWYFAFLFQILKYFEGPLEVVGTIVVPAVATAILFSLPLLDRAPGVLAPLRRRSVQIAMVYAGVAGVAVLTLLSWRADGRDRSFLRARRRADARAARALVLAARGVPPEGPLTMLRRDPISHGEELFVEHCAPCHRLGGDGGAKASDLTGFGSRGWILALLENPRSNRFFGHTKLRTMPAQTKIGPDGRRAAAEFLHAQGATDPRAERIDETLRARGEELFQRRCTGCHLFAGQGRDVEDGPEMAGYGSPAWIRAQIRSPNAPDRFGEANEMIVFGPDRLTEEDVDMLVERLRAERSR